VIVFRHARNGRPVELLMLERSKTMRFAGGAAVFPGGRIDPSDYDLAASMAHGLEPNDAAARIAAIREAMEETGLVLAMPVAVTPEQAAQARAMLLDNGELAPVLQHFGWQPDLGALHPWAHWRPNQDGAFDTRFYLADLGTGAVEISKDDTENSHLFWASAQSALAMAARGEISLVFPTLRNLERLAQFDDFASTREHANSFPIHPISPKTIEIDGTVHLAIPEGLGYPVTSQPLKSARRV
jgi:8-oxo-dGTP pyrophosphatase MutT (NUDIX family)